MNKAGLDLIEAESLDQVRGRCVYPMVTEEHRADYEALVQKVFRGEPGTLELRMTGLKGRSHWVYTQMVPLRNDAGQIIFALAVTIDITDRKRAEESLRRSEERWRFLVDTSSAWIWETDATIRHTYTNTFVTACLGYAPGDFLRVNMLDLVHPDDHRIMNEMVQAARSQRRPWANVVLRWRHKDGSWRYIESSGSPLFDEHGEFTGLQGVDHDVTERKRAEEELAERSATVQQIMDTASVGIALVDLTGRFTHANRRMAELFGLALDELIGSEYVDHVHPDEREIARQSMLSLIASMVPSVELDRRYRRKDGTEFWGHLTCNRFYDAKGNNLGLIGVISDITERKRTEQRIKESEQKYRDLFDSATDGIFILDLEGRFIDVNRTAHERLGYTKEEMLALHISRLDPPEFAARVPERLAAIRKHGVAVFESAHLRKDGTAMPVEVNSRLLNYEGRQVYFSVIRDITERKRIEEQIRQNEQFIRSILDTVDEGFIVIDQEYRILTANKSYCSQVARPNGDIIGKHCFAVSHGTYRPCYEEGEECAVREAFAAGEPRTAIHKHSGPDGQEIFVETKAYPLRDAAGTVTSVIETISNITEKHLLEEERFKVQKLESIGTLAGGIAHDFNNLLQGIFGYLSMARMTHDQKERSLSMLEQAEKALHQAVSLTSQLLTFSKGGQPVKERLSLAPVIENAAKFALSGSRSDCRLDIAPDLWRADADGGQLGQVIQNIVLNADQAMPLGGSVVITARNIAGTDPTLPQGLPQRDHVMISIQDGGVGIAEQYLSRIFDPYFTTKEKGSGLGLATSYSIMKNHDGLITVHSEPGKGSVFSLYIPAAAMAAEQQHLALAAGTARRGRILVMDDEEVVRMVTGELIGALGHEAAFAEHGEEALAAYQEARAADRPFDVVILDLTVRGGMGGAETVKRLREIDPAVKAIVSSGYSDDAITSTFRDHGFMAFLKKPYDIENLEHVLNLLLS